MADTKRAQGSNDKRKKKYRSDGTSIWAKRYIDGPGIWALKERNVKRSRSAMTYSTQFVQLPQILTVRLISVHKVASELWPTETHGNNADSDSDDEEDQDLSIEDQIANEVNAIKKSKKEPRFVNCQTNTTCVVFISCKPPVDPVQLVVKLVTDVQATGVVRSRCIHRLVPVTASCGANLPEIRGLCRKVLDSFFSEHTSRKFTYKIELRMRNHSVISRPDLIQNIAQCVPEGHTVELTNPEVFVLVEVFKSICGISVVQGYYDLQKFNMMEIANTKNGGDIMTERPEVFGGKEASIP